jgi:hypothetical protein
MPERPDGQTTLAIFGVAVAPAVFRLLGVRDERAQGVAPKQIKAIQTGRKTMSANQVCMAATDLSSIK